MAQILVPGLSQFKITGSVGSGVWDCIIHFFGTPTGGAYSQAQLQNMVTAFANTNWTPFLVLWPPTTTMTSITGVDLGVATPAVYTGATGFVGTGVGEQDAAACFMINYTTAARYRGGHGRTYLPGFVATDQGTPNTWAGADVTLATNTWTSAMNAMQAAGGSAGVAGCVQVIPTYNYEIVDVPSKHKYSRTRTSFKSALTVVGRPGSPFIRTQRRRLRSG